MRTLVLVAAGLCLAACNDSGGTSTAEMKTAAIEYTREQLKLGAQVPLDAKVWVGQEHHDDQLVMCGTVRDTTPASRVPPKRFAATGDPIRWLVFEDAHDAMVISQPDKFKEWLQLCGSREQSV